MKKDAQLAETMLSILNEGILKRWYPLVVDRECGGYYTNVTRDWTLPAEQDKMIVSQARHIWTTSKAASFLPERGFYEDVAKHGLRFLRDVMWDHTFGGFYQIRSRNGGPTETRGWRDEKRTYGEAFAVYGLAALYAQTGDPSALATAQTGFHWIEEHAFDPDYKGYFQFLTREGRPFGLNDPYVSIASDSNEVGFKDQNSSIHLLEAYTELYNVWKDEHLRTQLASILALIRDTMVHPLGYLQLFFHPDWTPVSFRDAEPAVREANFGLDHISFGHDYETAFLMLEASHALGLEDDVKTLTVGKRMLDHALANGWDKERGGFWDGSYYFKGDEKCTVVHHTKNWWAQAEALNILLLFSRIFPDGPYEEYFQKQWAYVDSYIIDHERGDWFEGGLDYEPHFRDAPKSHMWKCTYHTSRALMNCIALLSDSPPRGAGEGFEPKKAELMRFIDHWKALAGSLTVHSV